MGAAQSFTQVFIKRFKAQEVTPTKTGESFRFPLASGQLRQPGVDPRSPQSDPFDSSDPSSRQFADDDDEAEFQRFFGNAPASDVNEEDDHQKKRSRCTS